MKAITLLLTLSAIVELATAQSNATCLIQSAGANGVTTGLSATDFTWLTHYEDPSFYYRMAMVELCQVGSKLTGTRSTVV